MARYASYIICTSPRSGSTLLCGLLEATGVAGNPDSHFHSPSIADWMEDYGLASSMYDGTTALRAVFDAAIERGTGSTGTFGLRIQRHSFAYFMTQLAKLAPTANTDLDRIKAVFGETLFIYLTRESKLDQAVSFVRATQTGLWHRAPDGTEVERLSAPQPPSYDPKAIAGYVEEFTNADAAWMGWFEQTGIAPLHITYTDLAAEPTATLAQILDRLGFDQNIAKSVKPPVAKLSDATNRDWIDRYNAERV